MFNEGASNISIIFAPYTRGNFVRNCITLSPQIADAGLKMSDSDYRTNLYKKRVELSPSPTNEPPWGPGHVDDLAGDSRERLADADYSTQYCHCSHLTAMSFLMDLSNSKFIIITLDDETIHHFSERYSDDACLLNEINYYNDNKFLTEFTKSDDWYNLPYNDILNKDAFINHCININKDALVDKISNYYDAYSTACIENNPR